MLAAARGRLLALTRVHRVSTSTRNNTCSRVHSRVGGISWRACSSTVHSNESTEETETNGETSMGLLDQMDYEGLREFIAAHETPDLDEAILTELTKARSAPKRFRDRVRIRVKGGDGGKGCASFFRDNRVSRGPPDGGDGGPGGDVIIRATHQTSSLHHIRHIYTGGNGKTGSSGKKTGKRGADLILEVPPGTVIRPYEPNQPKGADEAEEVDAMEDLSVDQYQPEPTALSHLHDDEESPENGDEVVADEEGNAEYEEDAEQKPQIKPTVAPANDPVVDQAARAVMMSTAKASNNLKRTSRQKLVERMVQSYEYQVAKAAEPHIEPITASSVAATAPAHILKKNGLEVKGLVVDLDKEGAFFVAARGGAGGLGNWRLGAERKRPQSTALPGKPGTEGWFILELKLLADVGLVGFPNAGKSSFLAAVSRATPTVGSYPFTTLSPQIGSVSFPDHEQITIADLPGLIDGAHTNRGLGHEFLRHVERTNTLVYVLDITGSVMDRRALKVVDPFYTLITLRDELDKYLPGLSSRVVGIVANKMDLPGAKEGLAKLRNRIAQSKDKNLGKLPIWPISAQNKEGLDPVIRTMRAAVKGESLTGLDEKMAAYKQMDEFLDRIQTSGIAASPVDRDLQQIFDASVHPSDKKWEADAELLQEDEDYDPDADPVLQRLLRVRSGGSS